MAKQSLSRSAASSPGAKQHPPAKAATTPAAADRKQDPKKIRKLIDLGKERGYLTYTEVNEAVPREGSTPEELDSVDVDARRHGHRGRRVHGGRRRFAAEAEAEAEPDRSREVGDAGARRARPSATPPIRCGCTCRRWAACRFSSREEEVAIAKEIEAGEMQVRGRSVLATARPSTTSRPWRRSSRAARSRRARSSSRRTTRSTRRKRRAPRAGVPEVGRAAADATPWSARRPPTGKRRAPRRAPSATRSSRACRKRSRPGSLRSSSVERHISAIVDKLKEATDLIRGHEQSVRAFETRSGKTVAELLRVGPRLRSRREAGQSGDGHFLQDPGRRASPAG